jgi:hypothetical protein
MKRRQQKEAVFDIWRSAAASTDAGEQMRKQYAQR